MGRRRLRLEAFRSPREVPLRFWPEEPETSDPRRYVDGDWDPRERQEVLAYLAACYEAPYLVPDARAWCAFGCKHPTPHGAVMVTDGTWWFPETLHHYVEQHAVKPPGEFLSHIRSLGYRVPDLEVE